jgi:hypothetical protein
VEASIRTCSRNSVAIWERKLRRAGAVGCMTPAIFKALQQFARLLWAKSGHQQILFNHLVGAALYRLWHSNAERLGGLEIDDQLDFR